MIGSTIGDNFDLAHLAEALYPEQDSDGEIDFDGRAVSTRQTRHRGGARTELEDFLYKKEEHVEVEAKPGASTSRALSAKGALVEHWLASAGCDVECVHCVCPRSCSNQHRA